VSVLRALLFGSAIAVSSLATAAPGDDIAIRISVRDAGYMLGDLLDERIDIDLPPGTSLDAESLPAPGRVAPWMEVRSARLQRAESPSSAVVLITYQIFAEVETATRVPLPEIKLRVIQGEEKRPLIVPSRSFLLSPGLPSSLTDQDRELKPSPTPQMLAMWPNVVGVAIALVIALMCGAYLLWAYDRLPFLPRSPGPLLRLWRRSRRIGENVPDAERDELLRGLHAAFNRSAGETLYPSTLHRLFERSAFLTPLRESIERLFQASWNRFYGAPGMPVPSMSEALAILHRAADRERGLP